jgi:hypothetical protein
MSIDFTAAANSGVVRHLKVNAASPDAVSVARSMESCAPESVGDPYHNLGAHPDLVSWLWDELPRRLPEVCRWVVYGAPVLVNPKSGIIFGFAGGTHTYALRLPPAARDDALKAGCKRVLKHPVYPEPRIDSSESKLDDLGEEWISGQFQACEKDWCLAAYEFSKNHSN